MAHLSYADGRFSCSRADVSSLVLADLQTEVAMLHLHPSNLAES